MWQVVIETAFYSTRSDSRLLKVMARDRKAPVLESTDALQKPIGQLLVRPLSYLSTLELSCAYADHGVHINPNIVIGWSTT